LGGVKLPNIPASNEEKEFRRIMKPTRERA
jgi:hypothetical protein